MFNKVIILGYLTKDIEIKYLPNELTLAKTSIATTNRVRNFHDELIDEICFVEIIFWGRTADNAYKYLKKGSRLLIEGRLKYYRWSNSLGEIRSKHSITVSKFISMKRKKPTYYTTEFLTNEEIETLPVIDVELEEYPSIYF